MLGLMNLGRLIFWAQVAFSGLNIRKWFGLLLTQTKLEKKYINMENF